MCNEQGTTAVYGESTTTFTSLPPIQDKIEDDIEMYIEALHRCLVKYGCVDLIGAFNDMVELYVQMRAIKRSE